jgi:hypothetical protein
MRIPMAVILITISNFVDCAIGKSDGLARRQAQSILVGLCTRLSVFFSVQS